MLFGLGQPFIVMKKPTLEPLTSTSKILKKSHTKMFMPYVPGEFFQVLMKDIAPLFNTSNLNLDQMVTKVKEVAKNLTGSQWAEVLIKQEEELKLISSYQQTSVVPISESSLPGYVALNQVSQVINNPKSSSFYSSFETTLHPLSGLTKERVQVSSIAAVPCAFNGHIEGVIMLFNKLDQNKSQSFYTDNDLNLTEALGTLMLGLVNVLNYNKHLEEQISVYKKEDDEADRMLSCSMQVLQRKKLLNQITSLLKEEVSLDKYLVDSIVKVMECEGFILHLNNNGKLRKYFAIGVDFSGPGTTSTAEYCAFTSKQPLNVPDLYSEPLWQKEKKIKMRSLLACPIKDCQNNPLGVLEFFRKNQEFNSIDEMYSTAIASAIENLSVDYLEKSKVRFSKEKLLPSVSKKLIQFSLDQNEPVDYVRILQEINSSIKSIIDFDSCSVYFVDQQSNILWTRKSYSCDILTQPITEDTLLGRVYTSQTPICFPETTDSHSYTDFSMCLPVFSNLPFNVVGVVMLSRSYKQFTQQDLLLGTKICSKVGKIYELLYMDCSSKVVTEECLTEESKYEEISPMDKFVRLNARKSETPTPSSKSESSPVNKPISESISFISSLSSIPNNRIFELKSLLYDIHLKPERGLEILSSRLRQLIPCQMGRLLLMEQTEHHLVDVKTGSLLRPGGLIKKCIENRETICVPAGVSSHHQFDRYVDSLGVEQNIENFMAVPILHFLDNNALGVLAFVNASISFAEDDLAIAQFLSMIPREFAFAKDENLKKWQNVLKIGRRHKMLQQWCRQVFIVANSAQNKMAFARNLLHRLFEEENFEILLKTCLEVICAITNSEQSGVVLRENGELVEYLLEAGNLNKSTFLEEEKMVKRALESFSVLTAESSGNKENMIFVPFKKDKEVTVVEVWNKRDDTLSYFCQFNKEDELIVQKFAKQICIAAKSKNNDMEDQSLMGLRKMIRKHATSMNTYSLISTIRSAAQHLLDCDRASVFIREGKQMIVKAQGIEQEIPAGYSVPIGKGIIGNVAQTGQTENIKNVYEDPRFNSEVDMKTGYKTSTMLCMPVLDSNGRVIAALQMINKKQGFFDESDEETLEMFCEIIATVLNNWNSFENAIEERSRFLNILNSLGNYIFVLDSEGTLDYSNKSLENLFGVSEKVAKTSHYSSWLRQNRQLVYDITNIYQSHTKRIYRTAQRIFTAPLKRARTNPNIRKFNMLEGRESSFNYTIAALQDTFSLENSGIVLIFEDCSEIEKLNSKFQMMQQELLALKNPVQTQTHLQKCIQKLSLISQEIENPSINQQLVEIISTLKEGNLNKPEVKFPGEIQALSAELQKSLKEFTGIQENEVRTSPNTSRNVSKNLDENPLPIELNSLRDLDLDAFQVENKNLFMEGIFMDFDLMNQFGIPKQKLHSFFNIVKDHYDIYDNPFHNFTHGFNVIHSLYLILTGTHADSPFQVHEIFALFVAGLCHDVEHTGRTNTFEINKESHLSIIYNDNSVLENHHAAVTFKILQNERCNIISELDSQLRKSFRKMVIVAILGTDMVKHFSMISNMTARFKELEESPLGSREPDFENLAQLLLHCADLTHPCKTYDVYSNWSSLLSKEFTRQYNEEVSLGLPATEMMKDLHKPEVYYANEAGFLKFIVKPLWDCMDLWLNPHIEAYIQNLEENIKRFEENKLEAQKEAE